MSAPPAPSAEEVRNLFHHVLKSPALDYPAKRCSDSTTPGRFCEPCLRLESVDTKLYEYLKEVNKLLLIRAEVKERLNQHHDFTRHIPVEIISHIFALYTESFNSNFDPRLHPTVEDSGPLLLAAVSKSWREIAFGMPHLWNRVNIHILSSDNLPTKVELTKQWLDRSRRLPLYLSLVFETFTGQAEPEPDSFIPLFSVLQDVAPRWCKLVLKFSAALYTTFLGGLACAPTLDSLILIDESSASGNFCVPHTPLLKHLDISGVLLSEISIEWGNLTTFKSVVCVDEFFEVLRLVGGLNAYGCVGFVTDTFHYPLPTTPLTHSALRQLYLGTGFDIDPSELETLLDLAVFPSLERLGYRSSKRAFFPNRSLHSLLNRSHCRLTHFDLSGDLRNGTPHDIISILSDLPTITHLKLEVEHNLVPKNPIMSDQLLQRLTPTLCGEVGHSRLLPRLESLEFLGYKAFSWSCLAGLVSTTGTTSEGGRILPTISERQRSANPIRRLSFRVYFNGGMELIDTHSVAHFKDARDAGISIVILNVTHPLGPFTHTHVFPFDLLPSPTTNAI